MLYNNWNDPEVEMEEAAIQDFVDDIDDEEMDKLSELSSMETIDEFNSYTIPLYEEMLSQCCLVDDGYSEDMFYSILEDRLDNWE